MIHELCCPPISLMCLSTYKVFGWDTYNNTPDVNETDGRSYISAVSEIVVNDTQACDGNAKSTMGEARMDIEDSEIAYLGYHDSESYGLTWKVGRRTVFVYIPKYTVPLREEARGVAQERNGKHLA